MSGITSSSSSMVCWLRTNLLLKYRDEIFSPFCPFPSEPETLGLNSTWGCQDQTTFSDQTMLWKTENTSQMNFPIMYQHYVHRCEIRYYVIENENGFENGSLHRYRFITTWYSNGYGSSSSMSPKIDGNLTWDKERDQQLLSEYFYCNNLYAL